MSDLRDGMNQWESDETKKFLDAGNYGIPPHVRDHMNRVTPPSEEALRENSLYTPIELAIWKILGDDDFKYTDKPAKLEALLAEQIRLAYGRGSVDTIEHVKSWADKTEATYNEMLSERITELRKVGGTEWVKDTLRRKP